MNDYILFIDIETSDMPQRWNAPTKKVDEWPYILQVAWIVCRDNGELVKRENFYIAQPDLEQEEIISRLSGITPQEYQVMSANRKIVLNTLAADFQIYKPLIVGHFMDYIKRMLEVGFEREQINRNFQGLKKFCTMIRTERKNTHIFGGKKYLGLHELYEHLFDKKLPAQKNANVDVEALMDCFFELVRRGKITDRKIDKQKLGTTRRWELPIGLVIFIAVIMGASLFLVLHFFIK
ncbi:3'-5' exonuclease [Mangrovibacterium diazotrophicum]|uniref:DNA polymerase-3 subunit epsilon n=1 Tax=Mangrovibacterium diazotrophicum TaxID=1261403 RepID=A0A419WB68_9BACT|nr:3'-5' exonuclease [Mangrovibacterium diazotrophicum]RKD92708.1 DNA polymerase-3 subunit epsilon [Mangrovibacterium diazotrophicum]